MRTIFAIALAALVAAGANAHQMSEHGNITTTYPDQADTGAFSTVETVAPNTIPNGLFYFTVNGVQGGDTFTVKADDGQEVFVIGTDDQCPPADSTADDPQDPNARPTDPDWWLNDFNLLCNNHPDFDVKFTGGDFSNGPGDESGIVPGNGAAVVTLFFGDVGEGFTYNEK